MKRSLLVLVFLPVFLLAFGTDPDLSLDKTIVQLSNLAATSSDFTITTSGSWVLKGLPQWLIANKTSGTGGATVTLTTSSANTLAYPLSAYISVTSSGGTVVNLKVVQASSSGSYVLKLQGIMTKCNLKVADCNIDSVTVWWSFDTLFGEFLENGVFKWKAGSGTDELCLPYYTRVAVKCRYGDVVKFQYIDPTVPKSGTGFGYNVTGSPDWSNVFCGFGSEQNTCLAAADAKTFYKNFEVEDVFLVLSRVKVSITSATLKSGVGNSSTVAVYADGQWTASSSQTWLHTNLSSGTSNGSLVISADENPSTTARTGVITIASSGLSNMDITVVQEGVPLKLEITPSAISYKSNASSSTLDLQANVNWSISSYPSWVSLSSTSGSASASIILTASAYTGTTYRTGELSFYGSGVGYKKVTVLQSADAFTPTFSVSPASLILGNTASSTAFVVVKSNLTWTTTSDHSWLTFSKKSQDTILLKPQTITDSALRVAYLTISTAGYTPVKVKISQGTNPNPTTTTTTSGNSTSNSKTEVSKIENESGEFRVYPNPTDGHLHIRLDVTYFKNSSIEILSSSGIKRQSFKLTNQDSDIDLSSLAKGVYFIRLSSSELKQPLIRKIIKN